MPEAERRPSLVTRALINPQYARLFVAESVSVLGDFVFDTTVVLWIATVLAKGQSWAPAAAAGVLLAAALPAVVVSPFAGVFVDRWDYRRTMRVTDALRALLIASLVVVALIPAGALRVGLRLGIVYAIVLAASVCAQFFNPARFAIIGDIVPEPERARASGLGQIAMNLGTVIGPPLAAPVLVAFGVEWALIINALSFAVSYLLVSAIRVPEHLAGPRPVDGSRSVRRDLVAGLAFYFRSRVLVAVLLSAGLVTVGAGSINALDVFFVSENLHADPKLYGLLAMALGLGSIAGALLAGWASRRLGLNKSYWLGLLLCGIGFVGYARTDRVALAAAVLFLVGLPIAVVNSVAGPIILKVTPREMLGRVISVINPVLMLAATISIAVASWLASTVLRNLDTTLAGVHVRGIDTIFTVGGLLVVISALYAAAALQRLERPVALPATDELPR